MRRCGFESHLRQLIFFLKKGKHVVSCVVVLLPSALFNYLSDIHVGMYHTCIYMFNIHNFIIVCVYIILTDVV